LFYNGFVLVFLKHKWVLPSVCKLKFISNSWFGTLIAAIAGSKKANDTKEVIIKFFIFLNALDIVVFLMEAAAVIILLK
jgi:hypothetical protein